MRTGDLRELLAGFVRDARRFPYVPDPGGPDPASALLADEWDTAREFEGRPGGDCDGFACRTAQRGHEAALRLSGVSDAAARREVASQADLDAQARVLGEWRVVAGTVLARGAWSGHMWVAVRYPDGTEDWADPTWGLAPAPPAALGWPATRRPRRSWRHAGAGQFVDPREYAEGEAGR